MTPLGVERFSYVRFSIAELQMYDLSEVITCLRMICDLVCVWFHALHFPKSPFFIHQFYPFFYAIRRQGKHIKNAV